MHWFILVLNGKFNETVLNELSQITYCSVMQFNFVLINRLFSRILNRVFSNYKKVCVGLLKISYF